jgi:hypothetical protein
MQVTSLGFRTDLALRVLEGAEVTDRGDYTVVRSPDNPAFWWGNFLLLAGWPEPGTGDGWLARFAAEFPQAGHLALGVDAGHEPAQVPPEFLAAGLEFERATVLSCAAVQPPPRQTDPGARRRGLAGTLVWRAGVYAAEAFGAGTLVIVADPAEEAIRVYRACGFADAQGQFSFQRAAEG